MCKCNPAFRFRKSEQLRFELKSNKSTKTVSTFQCLPSAIHRSRVNCVKKFDKQKRGHIYLWSLHWPDFKVEVRIHILILIIRRLFFTMGQTQLLFVYFLPFLKYNTKYCQNLTIKALMVCLGFTPGTVGSLAQTNPLR